MTAHESRVPTDQAGPFKREERYIVFKRKHLSEDAETAVLAIADAFDAEVHNCVVVEHDWPEHEIVWNMIEERMACAQVS